MKFQTLPAMESGMADHLFSFEELVAIVGEWETSQKTSKARCNPHPILRLGLSREAGEANMRWRGTRHPNLDPHLKSSPVGEERCEKSAGMQIQESFA